MSSRGFTLLELLVVLAIVGLVLTVAAPRFLQAEPGTQARAAAQEMAGTFRQVRDKAIAVNRKIDFVFDLAAGRYLVDDQERPFILPGSPRINFASLSAEVFDQQKGKIQFFPDGSTSGGQVTLTVGTRTASVIVDWLTGRVRVER